MEVEYELFPGDAAALELIPIRRLEGRSHVEHVTGTFEGPTHPATLHAILDQVSAGTFDHATGDGVAC